MSNTARIVPDLSKIEPLDGTNYKRWSQRILIVLEQLEVDHVLYSDPPAGAVITTSASEDSSATAQKKTTSKEADVAKKYEKDNKTARGHILNHMTNPIFDLMVSNRSAKEIWSVLERKYGADDAGKKKYAVGNWLNFKMEEDQPIMEQVHKFENLTAEVLAEGMKMCDIFQANVLIEKLPDSWSEYKNKLKHKKRDMTLEELIGHMKIEEANKQKDKDVISNSLSVKANIVESRNSDRKIKAANQSKRPAWKNKNHTSFKRPGYNQEPSKAGCYVCGRTGHKAYQCHHRKGGNSSQGPRPQANIIEAEQKTFAAMITEVNNAEGKAEWIIDSGATKHFCSDKEQFTEFEAVNTGEVVYMGNASSAQIKGKGKITLKLTSGKILSLSNVAFVPSLRRNLISAGLLIKAGMKLVLEADKLVISKNGIFVGKGYLSNDFKGTESKGGKHYYITFVDDYSRYTKVYLLKTKDEAAQKFLTFKTESENQLDRKVKRLRTDRGGEYGSKLLKDICESSGIIHETTAPYCPQQNGVAERKNRTLKNMMNAMIISSGLPNNLWGEAVLSATHILNRVPHKRLDKTPYELWKGYAPNLEYLKVWGCLAKVGILSHKRSVVGAKTFDCVFVGYATNSVAYRFMRLDDRSICEYRDAVFFEDQFPLNDPKPTIGGQHHAIVSNNKTGNNSSLISPIGLDPHSDTEATIRRSKRQKTATSFGSDFITSFITENANDE
ncbi:Retrovirus-related Pol polyprotein from transposon TNT 1-94, partial [Linum perenne]